MPELTKSDKKILRAAIDIGLQKDFAAAILTAEGIVAQWKEKQLDNRDAYHSLFREIKERDKLIARRYDGLTGSGYVDLVVELHIKGSVSEAELAGLFEETMNTINLYKHFADNLKNKN
jgi:hypothetical protein